MVSISLYIEEWPEAIWKKTLCSTIELIGFSCVYLGALFLCLVPIGYCTLESCCWVF